MNNEELCAAIQNGHEELLPVLWDNVKLFSYKQARNYYRSVYECGNKRAELEDIKQSAYIGFDYAVKHFDITQGKSFLGYLDLAMKRPFHIAAGFRAGTAEEPSNYALSLDAPTDSNTELTLGEIIPALNDDIADAEQNRYREEMRTALNDMIRNIPEDEQLIIRKRYFDNIPLEELCNEYGKQAKKLNSKALSHLRRQVRQYAIVREYGLI